MDGLVRGVQGFCFVHVMLRRFDTDNTWWHIQLPRSLAKRELEVFLTSNHHMSCFHLLIPCFYLFVLFFKTMFGKPIGWPMHLLHIQDKSFERRHLYCSDTKSIQTIALCCCTDATSTALHAQIRSTYLLHFWQSLLPACLAHLFAYFQMLLAPTRCWGHSLPGSAGGSAAVSSHLQVAVQAEQLRIWNLDELGIPIF